MKSVPEQFGREKRMEDKIIRLARAVISREPKCRPETKWIQQQVNKLIESQGIGSRSETDRLIYERMYAKVPEPKDMVKLRYWRTGHHLPSGRKEALMYAGALGLDRQETAYFLQACMEKSDWVFEEPPDREAEHGRLYEERISLMETMLSEYIDQVPPMRIIQLNIPYEKLVTYMRHLYCIDALDATALCCGDYKRQIVENHFSSMNYESEFLRIRRLLGEIPRKVMLRHIFLLGIPYLNRRLVDERLCRLGYLPLTEGHTSVRGAVVDDLVIGLLSLYQEDCTGLDPLQCRQWMLERLGVLDQYLRDSGNEAYRFIYFRSLSTMVGYGDE